jgi:hypothetical protein
VYTLERPLWTFGVVRSGAGGRQAFVGTKHHTAISGLFCLPLLVDVVVAQRWPRAVDVLRIDATTKSGSRADACTHGDRGVGWAPIRRLGAAAEWGVCWGPPGGGIWS